MTLVVAAVFAFVRFSVRGVLPFVDALWQLYAAYLVMAHGWTTMSNRCDHEYRQPWFSANAVSRQPRAHRRELRRDLYRAIADRAIGASGRPALLIAAPRSWPRFSCRLRDLIDAPACEECERAQFMPWRRWTRARALRSWPFWSITLPFSLPGSRSGISRAFRSHSRARARPDRGGLAVATTTALR